jgi:hypothetical protein
MTKLWAGPAVGWAYLVCVIELLHAGDSGIQRVLYPSSSPKIK